MALLLCCSSSPLSFTNRALVQVCIWELGAGFAWDDLGKKDVEYFSLFHIICHSFVSPIQQQTCIFSELPFTTRILVEPLLFTLDVLHLP